MKLLTTTVVFALISSAAWANDQLTPIGDLVRGMPAIIAGTIDRITDEDEFRLRDASGTVRVYIGPNWVPAVVGETVTVAGLVDDDPGPLEVYARSLTRADGSVVVFQHYDD